MANYTKATNFTAKDSLPSGNAGKIIKGAEIDTEFTAIASAIASKADLNSPALTGTPTAPTAAASTNTTQLATTAFVQSAIGNAITGIIVMWSGSIANIPTGWVLCNGSNGTPDLRNRFIIGAHSDNVGVANTTVTGGNTQTGGSKDAIVVSHTHTVTAASTSLTGTITGISESFNASGSASGVFTKQTGFTVTDTPVQNDSGSGGQVTLNASHTHSMTVSTEGSSGTNQNLPPYYALAFIMKT
jgi:hypothetical protein